MVTLSCYLLPCLMLQYSRVCLHVAHQSRSLYRHTFQRDLQHIRGVLSAEDVLSVVVVRCPQHGLSRCLPHLPKSSDAI